MHTVGIAESKPLTLTTRFSEIRSHSVALCKPLQQEDYVVQPTVDISPPKWHLAHSTWFWEEFVLSKYQNNYKRFHERYAFLFNSYYESVGERVMRLDRGNMSRPTVNEILDYRKYVDECMVKLLEHIPGEAAPIIELGLNHEQQHQELLYTDIKYILGHNPLFPAYDKRFNEFTGENKAGWITIPKGKYEIGYTGNDFCFDNELSTHAVYLHEFEIASNLVTNGEYLSFMKDEGYSNALYWHSDAWTWVNENDIDSPLYWHYMNGEWKRYSLAGLETVNPNEPVTHISFYEAAAFAEWKNMRLPTEFEWEIASDKLEWGQRWEHTNSAYLPYPGFAKPAGAVGEYNGKFMINQMVLRGASIATPKNHSRKTYRNFFHPHLRWQFNGLRLCKKQTL
jgi:ergothioneine biosynthesis protein EgtB